jgi:hypothetical protein
MANTDLIVQVNTFTVTTQQEYDNAAELCKEVKARIKAFEDKWKPLKDKAYASWKSLCAEETEALKPYKEAETAIKARMTDFQRKRIEEERLQREEQERWKREEAERLLKLAAEADQAGRAENADYLMEMAEQTQHMVIEQPKAVKTAGTAAKTTWKARIVNDSLVPITFAGTMLRPVDTSTLDKLAKASKGTMAIPGVEFYEDISVAISRG